MNTDEYLAEIRARILADPLITHWLSVREKSEGDAGQSRYRLALADGSFLEAFEWFEIKPNASPQTLKYSFHWQDANGKLLSRWDNAPHHPAIQNAPHHWHDGAEDNVKPHSPMTLTQALDEIRARTRP